MHYTLPFSSETFYHIARTLTHEIKYRNPNSFVDEIRVLANRCHLLAGNPNGNRTFSSEETRLLEHVFDTQLKRKKKAPLDVPALETLYASIREVAPDPFEVAPPPDVSHLPTHRIPFDIYELREFSRTFGQQRARGYFASKYEQDTLRIQQTMSVVLKHRTLPADGFRLALPDITLLRTLLDRMVFEDPRAHDRYTYLLDTTLDSITDTLTPEVFA